MTHQCGRGCMAIWAFFFWSLKVAIHATSSSHCLIDDVQHFTFNDHLIGEKFHEIHPDLTLKFALKNNTQQICKLCYQRKNYKPNQNFTNLVEITKQTRGTQHYNLVLQWSAETGIWRFERRKSDTEFMQQLGRAVMAYKYKPVYR